jgi:hypothetical protein
MAEFDETLKEFKLILFKLSQKIKSTGNMPNSFYEVSIILIAKQTKAPQEKKTTGQYR